MPRKASNAGKTAAKSASKATRKTARKTGKNAARAARTASSQGSGPFGEQLQGLVGVARQRAAQSTATAVTGMTQRLTEYAAKGGGPGLIRAFTGKEPDVRTFVRGAVSPAGLAVKKAAKAPKRALEAARESLPSMGRSGRPGRIDRTKATNIVESIDVAVPVGTAYELWTQFDEFPAFMKKVENVEQESDEKLTWRARVLWSHRTWEATILDQVPDKHIVWRSEGEKGRMDGAVSFHELAPELTRILLSMEYYSHGLFERTANLRRAQGRRVRLGLERFRRHAMAETLLRPDEQ